MAIDIIYLDESRGVIMRICDTVNGKQVIDAHNKVYEQHMKTNQEYYIIDKSWCSEYNVSVQDIQDISRIYQKIAKLNSNLVLAVIESSLLQFSLTEACLAHIEEYIQDSKSFQTQNEAQIWIGNKLYEKNINCKALE